MTSSLLTPKRRVPVDAAPDAMGSTAPTAVLDWTDDRVATLVRSIGAAGVLEDREVGSRAGERLDTLRRAHRAITSAVRPVYSVQDERPVSEVLRRGRGSCSQRLAVLEAVARASGIATRVRGLLLDGAFWYPRFPRMRQIVPDCVVLAWPEFLVEAEAEAATHGRCEGGQVRERWLTASEIFGDLNRLSREAGGGFSNSGSETLFEALSRTALDWDGVTVCPTATITEDAATVGTGTGTGERVDARTCDLSSYVVADLGRFGSRDELFARYGQTLCPAARVLAEPILGRWAAGARTGVPKEQ
ncbi:transglutaminase domain-containing protein [Streptomyces sp. NPDC003456]|uniref:transglutaminase domain-containing protein n=1 Tax=Streptomyces sp. NPDC003456 TaxID=3364683 RepID=UPI00369722D9